MLSHPGKSVGVKTLLPTDALIDYFGHPVRHPKGKEANRGWLSSDSNRLVWNLGTILSLPLPPAPEKRLMKGPRLFMKRLFALLCKAMVAPTKADLHVPVKYGWPRLHVTACCECGGQALLKVKDRYQWQHSCCSHLRFYDTAC